jgi:hypothetical protein
MPLDSVYNHIDFIMGQIKQWKSSSVPYPGIRKDLVLSADNHINGLNIIKNILSKAIIKPAKGIQERLEKEGKKEDVEDIIRKHWFRQVTECYHVVERFNFDFNNQTSPILPFETYYWVQSVLENWETYVPLVLEASNQFMNHSFKEKILDPLAPLIEVGSDYTIPGTLEKVDVTDVLEGFKISEGYIISYIRGEAKNILLWPILVHEAFHIIDREKNLVDSLSSRNVELPTFNEVKEINSRWIQEIFVDIFSAKYFGPMYLISLVNYFERLPYVQTIDHPEMALRIRAVQEYVTTTDVEYTDIFDKCKSHCFETVGEKVQNLLAAADFSSEKEEKIIGMYKIVSGWFDKISAYSFRMALKNYQLQKNDEKSEKTFADPLYKFSEIADLVLDNQISLAIDPRILLNVVMAQYEQYDPEKHFEIMTDSILKWKIRKEWNKIICSS